MAETRLRVLSGIVAAGLILGVAELLSAPVGVNSAPVDAFGSAVVDNTPDGMREWAIKTFGTGDKAMLFVVIVVGALVISCLAGALERRRRPIGSAIFVVFGIVGVFAACTRAEASSAYALPTTLGVIAGIVALRLLIRRIEAADPPLAVSAAAGDQASTTGPAAAASRRQVLRGVVTVGALAAVTGVAGRIFGANARDVSADRAAVRLPTPIAPPPTPPAGEPQVPGLTPYVTSNTDFYRIDTALRVPQLSTADWSLRIHGMVDREITLSYADLARRPAVETMVTLACVSNPVGGDLIGNARWLGYRLADLLAEAGPHADADMVLSRSVDNFTAGTPLSVLTDGRDAMLAVGMNGEPLPVKHGYPARLVVPGLYGYVSATKWVVDLEVTRFDRAQAYWTRRGWSERGPVKTGIRIDTPGSSANLAEGRVAVAGVAWVAWAQHRGIETVEVQVDSGRWQQARLADEPSVDTWRQWVYEWDAVPGRHTLRARATDGAGAVQTSDVQDVLPDGATGYPSVAVRVG